MLVVDSFDALDREAARARGRIVLFNVPFTTYGETVRYRTQGPVRAAQHGAVAMLIRGVGPIGLRTPHTGSLLGGDTARRRIPGAVDLRGGCRRCCSACRIAASACACG